MPAIMLISNLRNYTDELDSLRILHNVLGDLKKAEMRSNREGWVSDEEMQKVMGLDD